MQVELITIYEIIGYIASGLVALSLTMTSILRLRVINSIGAAVFVTYGLFIGAYPIVFVNGFIFIINLYNLYQITNRKEFFTLLEIEPTSEYLAHFLEIHHTNIAHYLPDFDCSSNKEAQTVVMLLSDAIPAGIFIGEHQQDETMKILLDFAIPGYRDFKLGKFLFNERCDFFIERNIHQLITHAGNQSHQKYLNRMGFQTNSENDLYSLTLKP